MKLLNNFITSILRIIDKLIVVPIGKALFIINKRLDEPGKKIENWLSKTNTLLFLSLALAIIIFITVDQKILNFSTNSAEVLKDQTVTVLYDQDRYVVEGVPENVDITLIGSKADLYIATQSPSNEVTLDLWGLGVGQHQVDLTYSQLNANIDHDVNPAYATVIISEKISATKTLSIDLLNQDLLDEKYIIEDINTDITSVVIKGSSTKVEKVATVKALVDINSLINLKLGTEMVISSSLKAYDDKGNVVDVEISPSTVDVKLLIESPSKEVPIRVIPNGNVNYDMGISNLMVNGSSEVTYVTIYGSENDLKNIEYIPVNVNVEGLNKTTSFDLELSKPSGVKTMSVSIVNVEVQLSDDITNKDIKDVVIKHENLGSDFTATPVDIATTTVQLKGISGILDSITSSDIIASVDLNGLGIGTHEVEIIVTGPDARVEYSSAVLKMKVIINKK